MRVDFTFYGTLRQATGETTVASGIGAETSALQATGAVAAEGDELPLVPGLSGGSTEARRR